MPADPLHPQNPRTVARIARVKRDIPLLVVLEDYGYRVRSDAGDREQQFPCDLHGDGHDNKPSARVYPGDEQPAWYCYACSKSRDVIETVREKEGLGFMEALAVLERKYKLPALPWDESYRPPPSLTEEMSRRLAVGHTYGDVAKATKRLLEDLTHDHSLPLRTVLGLWEAFDKVCYLVAESKLREVDGKMAMNRILTQALERDRK